MKELVFDYKKGKEPYKWDETDIKRRIESIIGDINKPKEEYLSGSSGTSGCGESRKKRKITKRVIVDSTDITKDTCLIQEDYLDYLERCYEWDNGYVIKPDFIWFTIMCEMANIINGDPETFRKYYTVSPKKILIILPSSINKNGIPELPIDIATEEVMKRVPSDISEELIAPKFTTSTEKSQLAFRVAFLESVKEYYSFGTVGCGYSRVKILGEIKDYKLMITNLKKIMKIIPEFKPYFTNCISAIQEIIKEWNNKYFWSYICWSEHGYGSHSIDGWFTKFFRFYTGERAISKSQFPKHIAKVEYTHNESKFIMYLGILTTTYDDGCYVPDFTKIIVQEVVVEEYV